MKLLFLLILLVLTTTVFSQTPRNRVKIQNGTLVTDKGTLLRGVYISTDVTNIIPSKDEISGIKNFGLNCIHLYAECPEFQTPGEKVKLIDSIVNITEKDSLYVILTIGGCDQNGKFNLAFVKSFWNFYAPRYADKTHVIFEIVNEPFAWSAPYDSSTIAMEKAAYDIIRSHAPQTHILFMSYANAINDTSMVADVKKLGKSIDWSNASIATHGYGTASENFRSLIKTVKDSGYALTVTEPEWIGRMCVNLATTRVFEQEFVSYTHFISVRNLINDPSVFKKRIESSELRWDPDFGTWPESISEITYTNPYQSIYTEYYDEGYGFKRLSSDTAIGCISNNDYIAYYNFDFQDGPETFEAECSSAASGGSIELHLDSINGSLVGTCSVIPTGDWEVYEPFSCTTSQFNGIHKLYLIFKGNKYDLLNLKCFVFKKSAANHIKPLMSTGSQRFQIYPNPTKGFINVTIDEIAIIKIYDIHGKILIKKQLSVKNNIIQVNNLPSGSYLAEIISNAQVFSQILIIE